ncbi:DUF3795 domain-containing protein [Oscillospiraceae bacterium PP1C4]
MARIISCCGMVCSGCDYYPQDCKGCPSIEGKAFWLQFTGGDVCEIYNCCVNEKGLKHCGQCSLLPCELYSNSDPTRSEQENQDILKKQLKQLQSMQTNENPDFL